MPFVSRIEARAYSRATELVERVADAVLKLYPENVWESVQISKESVDSHRIGEIVVISATLEKKELCEPSFSSILESFSEQDRKLIGKSLHRRLDDQCVLFLRIDKQASFLGETRLARDSDLISVKVHLRDYPKCLRSDAESFLIDRLSNSGVTG